MASGSDEPISDLIIGGPTAARNSTLRAVRKTGGDFLESRADALSCKSAWKARADGTGLGGLAGQDSCTSS